MGKNCIHFTPPFKPRITSSDTGVTLIELSIVLVIIGLVVGGVMVGRQLIEVAQTRQIISEIDSYKSALSAFRLKYNGLPGDITNATTFWGADASCPSTPTNTVKKQATCNGNGNGFIRGSAACVHGEIFRSWQQLANSGLVSGQFTGVSNPTACGAEALVGINIPRSAFQDGGYTLGAGAEGLLCYSSHVNAFDSCHGNALFFGGQRSGFSVAPLMPPSMAFSIDAKLDDGRPAYGKIMSVKLGSTIAPGCRPTNVAIGVM